jgi:futalosine hydrolase
VDLAGCDTLGEVLSGCRVVLLAATEAEARPLREALTSRQSHVVATKSLDVGRMGGERPALVALGVTGCDKANVAHLLTCVLQAAGPAPELVVQVGIAGGFGMGRASSVVRGKGTGQAREEVGDVVVGDVIVATTEAYSDTGSTSPSGWLSAADLGLPIARMGEQESGGVFPLDPRLAGVAQQVILAALKRPRGPRDVERSPEPGVLLGLCITSSCATGLSAEARELERRWGALAESMEGAAAAQIAALYGVPFLEIRAISNLVTDRDRESWEVDRAIEIAAISAVAVVAALDRLPLGGREERG